MKIILASLILFLSGFAALSKAPIRVEEASIFTETMQFALYIKDSHTRMNQWLKAVGKRPTKYPLPWKRARYYSERFIGEIDRRGLSVEFLWGFVVPYVDHGTGFINGLTDMDLKKPSIGIFEIGSDTARWVVYRCRIAEQLRDKGKNPNFPASLVGKHGDKSEWNDERWIEFLIYEMSDDGSEDAISFGFDLLQIYHHDYGGSPDKIFHALAAGPTGAAEGVKVNFANFHERQRKARKFQNFVSGEA